MAEDLLNLLKTLITFIAATILGAVGQQILGLWGMLLGSLAGAVIGWWGARRLMP